jgi:hypothetical protein
MRRLFVVLFLLLTASVAAAAPGTKIEVQPVPDWVYDAIFDLDAGYGNGVTDEESLKVLKNMGVTCVSARVRMHTQDVEKNPTFREQVAKISANAKKTGTRWFAYFIACHDLELAKAHPDWRVHETPDGQLSAATIYTFLCFNSPWGEEFIRKLTRLERDYRPDGFLIDGENYISPFCYCQYCREKYKKDTGCEIPLKLDLGDPAYCRYVRWRDQVKIDLAQRTRDALRAINPDVVLMPWFTGPGRWWHMETPARLQYKYEPEILNVIADFPVLEMFWDWPAQQESPTMADFSLRYLAGLRRGRPFGPSTNCAAHGQQATNVPRAEILFRTAMIITNGGQASPTWSWTKRRSDYKDLMDFIRARQPWTTRATTRSWLAVLSSENTRFFYGRAEVRDKYLFHCAGAFRCLQEDHLPFEYITDLDLEEGGPRLDSFAAILLPNAACLSDRAVANLRAYVERGGGLIATLETSLYSENGVRRPDFGLADLFGAHFKSGPVDHSSVWPHMIENVEKMPALAGPQDMLFSAHPLLADPLIETCFTGSVNDNTIERRTDFFGKALEVTPMAGSETIVQRRASGATGAKPLPVLILRQFGKGKVAYFPDGVDEAYFRFPLPVQRRLITRAVRWVAAAPPTVEIDAPGCVYMTCFEKKAGNKKAGDNKSGDVKADSKDLLIVHLLNESNTTGGKSLAQGSPPQREEVLPILNIRVRFLDPGIKKVTQQPENRELPIRPVRGGVEAMVPLIEIHSMIVAEK